MAKALLMVVLAGTCFSVGCGGGNKSAKAPAPGIESKASESPDVNAKPEGETSEADGEEQATSTQMPTACSKPGDKVCTPPGSFVKKLCQGSYPSIALAMFAKGTPWTRGYLTRKTKAWNASGGASESDYLEFDEEVLILRKRADDLGGMQVSGAGGGYDALRWNGACVTLAKEELTTSLPPKAKYPKVEWRMLDDSMQEAMRNDEKLNDAYRSRQNECKGATMGTVSTKCLKKDQALSDAIIRFVRDGGEIGKPERLP